MSAGLQQVRALFAEFERSIGKPEARDKLQEAIDEALDTIEGDCAADEKKVVQNLLRAYARRVSEEIREFLDGEARPEWERCDYFIWLATPFLEETALGDDPNLRGQLLDQNKELFDRMLRDGLGRASASEREQVFKILET